jgi:hypothetical protein
MHICIYVYKYKENIKEGRKEYFKEGMNIVRKEGIL